MAVGLVEGVEFSDGLDQVIVTVRLKDDKIAQFIDADAGFWVVQPEVTTRGVSGLDTVLSGVFIEGVWDQDPGGFVAGHTGLDEAPLLGPGERGTIVRLRAAAGASLNPGTPILFKGIEVGRVGTPDLLPGGAAAETDAVIFEPYDQLVTSSTRFWDTSGFSFSLGASGAQLDFSSVATLISGGVTFETVVSGGVPVEDGATFELFPDEGSARSSLFSSSTGPVVNIAVIFDENVSGLGTGAPVELRGVNIGEVENVTGLIDEERYGDDRVRLLATLGIRPARMGIDNETEEAALAFLSERIGEGLRARLASASILTGGLKVELIQVEDAEPAAMDMSGDPFPIVPTTESEVSDVTATAEGVFKRINELPIEELIQSAVGFLEAATDLAGNEELGRVPGEVTSLIEDVRGVVASEAVQAIPDQVGAVLEDVRTAVADLRAVVSDPAWQAVPGDVSGLIGDARTLVGSDAAKALPGQFSEFATELDTAAARINELLADDAFGRVPGQISAILDDVEGITGAPEAQTLPQDIATLLAEIETAARDFGTLTADLNEAGATERLLAAVDGASEAAAGVSESVVGVPELVETLNSVALKADALPVEQVAADLSAALQAAREILATDDAKALPASLNGALDEVEAAIAELRAGGTVDNVNRTLASAADAADALETATARLPELVQRLERLATQASATLAGYDTNAEFGRTMRATLREVQEAAEAASSLARALERRPNSIILGR